MEILVYKIQPEIMKSKIFTRFNFKILDFIISDCILHIEISRMVIFGLVFLGVCTFILLHRPMCRALIEKNYWLIEMNIRKTPQASVFSFIVLKLAEKAVLHFLLNMLDYIKRALRNKQLITFNADNLKGKS